MFGNHFIADQIARKFVDIDENLRQRFIRRNNLNNENHYTQLFAEHINLAFSSILPIFTTSSVLRPSDERKFGCDCIIIFQFGKEVKIGLFEAKWPFRQGWDYPQNGHPSHFTNQLERQCAFKDVFAIWETFYDSSPLHNSIIPNNRGSMCSWHQETHDYQASSVIGRKWNLRDVSSLIGINGHTIYQIIYSILICNKGNLLDTKEGKAISIKMANNYSEQIPLPLDYESGIEGNQEILSFMKKNGIGLYSAFDLTEITI